MRWSEEDYDRYRRKGQAPVLSEAAWQSSVMRVLKDAGFMTYHTHDSRHSPSGWPDVAAIKPTGGTLYLCELKREDGHVTPAQAAWLAALAGCTGVVSDVWRPKDLEKIVETLRGI